MKATGIVRRIDDLGRIVIPKEIRRTMRIREGDPLEIFTDNDGAVIFKKYSPIGEMVEFATQIAESIYKQSNMPVVVFDRDHCVAASGVSKKEVLERRLSQHAEEFMESRIKYVCENVNEKKMYPLEGVDKSALIFVPIIAAGDVSGAVVMLESDIERAPDDSDVKLCSAAATFLGFQMEE